MSRLIHYSHKPLGKLYSREHTERQGGYAKTPGLWVSVEGPDDWASWCESENFGIGPIATEIFLAPNCRLLRIFDEDGIDDFSRKYVAVGDYFAVPDWLRVRAKYQGMIISPYIWERRLSDAMWYYCWDCASGVIWDVSAIAETRVNG